MLLTEITKSHLNKHICQHRGMKTSTVTPSFYYVFNISLYCNDTISSFIGNLWRVLLLGNHLKPDCYHFLFLFRISNISEEKCNNDEPVCQKWNSKQILVDRNNWTNSRRYPEYMNVVPRSTGTQIVEQRINSEVQI